MAEEITVSEGMMTSTPDNYEDLGDIKPQAPITVAERDRVLNAPLISPADESRVAVMLGSNDDGEPRSGEEVQAALDVEAQKQAEKSAKEQDDLKISQSDVDSQVKENQKPIEPPVPPTDEQPTEASSKTTNSKSSSK